MVYWIFVYNIKPIRTFNSDAFLNTITQSNFVSLCEQYGLNPALIEPTLKNLRVRTLPVKSLNFFSLRYKPDHERPIMVTAWERETIEGKQLLAKACQRFPVGWAQNKLFETRQILGIELSPTQLTDLGLLLGYEIARWGAEQGKGLVEGLDGKLYQLNEHQAFIPLSAETE